MPAKRGAVAAVVNDPPPADDELAVAIGNLRIANDNVVAAEHARHEKRRVLCQIYEDRIDILREIVATRAREGQTYGQIKTVLAKYHKAHHFPRDLYMPRGDFRIFNANQANVVRPSPLIL